MNSWTAAAIVLSGILLYWSHLAVDKAAVLAFASTAPWLLICHPRWLKTRTALLMFATLAYGIALASTEWLRAVGTAGWLMSTLFYIPLFIPTFVLARAAFVMWPHVPLSVIWPLAFTAGEWFRIRFSPGEVPFGQLAQSLVAFPSLLQSADLAGGWGLSFLTSSVAAGLTGSVWQAFARYQGPTGRGSKLAVYQELALPLALLASSSAYGYRQLQPWFLSEGPRVQIVQTNLTGWSRDRLQANHRLQAAVDLTRTNLTAGVDLVVWPENSFMVWHDGRSAEADRALNQLWTLSRIVGAPIVADGAWFPRGDREEHHTVTVAYPNHMILQSDKQLLVPWSEYVPFQSALNIVAEGLGTRFEQFVRQRNPFLATIVSGDVGPRFFKLDSTDAGSSIFVVPICYEILSARFMNDSYRHVRAIGVDRLFVVNVVNERLLGASVHGETLAFSRLRAVEGRVSVVRATNNGVSAVIDSNGDIKHSLPDPTGKLGIDQIGTFSGRVTFDRRFGTLYSQWGDYLPFCCLLVIALACAHASLRHVWGAWAASNTAVRTRNRV